MSRQLASNPRIDLFLAQFHDFIYLFTHRPLGLFRPKLSETRFREILTSGNDDPVAVETRFARADGLQQDFEGAHATGDAAGKYTDPSFFSCVLILLERGEGFLIVGRPASRVASVSRIR